jgi:hypothetical protein
MPAKVTGDTEVKFGLTGATGPSIGVVESISFSNSYITTAEAKDVEGMYTGETAVNMSGKVTEVTISGIANADVTLIKPGEALTLSKGSNVTGTYPTSLYVTSMEVTGSAGEFNKVSITGYGADSLDA